MTIGRISGSGAREAGRSAYSSSDLPPLEIDHSFFESFINTLSAPLYSVANLAKGEFGDAASVLAKGVFGGELFGYAQMNKDETETTADVLKHYGVQKGLGRDIAGFIGDIAFDPLTYLTGGTASGARTAMSKIGGNVVKHALTETGEKALGAMARSATKSTLKSQAGKIVMKKGAKRVSKIEASRIGAREAEENFFTKLGKEVAEKENKKITQETMKEAGVETSEDLFKQLGVEQAKNLGYLDPGGVTAHIPFTKVKKNLISHDDMVGLFSKTGASPEVAEMLAKQVSSNIAFPIVGGVFAAGKGLLGNTAAFKSLVSKIDSSHLLSEADRQMFKDAGVIKGETELLGNPKNVFYQNLPEEFRASKFAEAFDKGGAKEARMALGDKDIIDKKILKEFENEMFKTAEGHAPTRFSEAYQNSQDFFFREHLANKTEFSGALEVLGSVGVSGKTMTMIKNATVKGDFKELEKIGKLIKDDLGKAQISDMVESIKSIGKRENHVFHNVSNFEDYKASMFLLDVSDKSRKTILETVKELKDDKLLSPFKKKVRKGIYEKKGLSKQEIEGIDTLLNIKGDELQKILNKDITSSQAWRNRTFDTFAEGELAGVIYEKDIGRVLEKQIDMLAKDRFHNHILNTLNSAEIKAMKSEGLEKVAKEGVEQAGKAKTIKKSLLGKIDVDKLDISIPMKNKLKEITEIEIPDALFSAFEDLTRQWIKPFLTTYNPSFHVRNMMSGSFMAAMNPRIGFPEFVRSVKQLPQLMLKSFKGNQKKFLTKQMDALGAYDMMGRLGGKANLPDDVLKSLKEVVTDKVTGAKYTMEDLISQARSNGLLDTGFELEVAKGGSGKWGAFTDYANGVANRGENYMRFAHFVENVKSGLPVDQSVSQTKKWFVDYTPSSGFERKLRTIIPFYKFTKQVLKEYGGEIARRPGSIAPYKALYHLNEKEENIPSWMKKTFTVPMGKDKDGNPLFATGFGLPIEALANVGSLSGALSMLNPMAKFPLELASGKNFFFGSEYASYDAPYQSILAMPPSIKDKLLNKHTNKNGEIFYTMNPEYREIIDRIPMYRQFATVNKLLDTRTSFFTNLANSMTGINIKSLDERQRQRVANEMIEKALKQAKKEGRVSQFTNYYQRDYSKGKPVELQHQTAMRKFLKSEKKKRDNPNILRKY